jgi:hypothetical protein
MTERAAHLVDAVLPRVPVRQWVLSLPHWLRYMLAWDHGLCRAVLAVFHPSRKSPHVDAPGGDTSNTRLERTSIQAADTPQSNRFSNKGSHALAAA